MRVSVPAGGRIKSPASWKTPQEEGEPCIFRCPMPSHLLGGCCKLQYRPLKLSKELSECNSEASQENFSDDRQYAGHLQAGESALRTDRRPIL